MSRQHYIDVCKANGATGLWPLDDSPSSTTVTDLSGNGRNGTYNNSPNRSAPRLTRLLGNSVQMLGGTASATNVGFAVGGTTFLGSTNATVEVWLILHAQTNYEQCVWDFGAELTGFHASIDVGGVFHAYHVNSTMRGRNRFAIKSNRVYHIVHTHNRGAVNTLYVNGRQVGEDAAFDGNAAGGDTCGFGSPNNNWMDSTGTSRLGASGQYGFVGRMEWAACYASVLSFQDVRQRWILGSIGPPVLIPVLISVAPDLSPIKGRRRAGIVGG